MLEVRVVQEVRVGCDRCGVAAGGWHPTVPDARQAAVGRGFSLHEWLQEGCVRELWLCPACNAKAPAGGGSSIS